MLRNYPIIGHLRFLLECIRPEIRQYFIESDSEAAPFSRAAALAGLPARQERRRTSGPSAPSCDVLRARLRVDQPLAGADAIRRPTTSAIADRRQPALHAALRGRVFNISAMSFGALVANAIRALNRGAQARRLRARHRRGLDQPLPPRARRRPDLGDRLRLLRLPRRRRHASIAERFASSAAPTAGAR